MAGLERQCPLAAHSGANEERPAEARQERQGHRHPGDQVDRREPPRRTDHLAPRSADVRHRPLGGDWWLGRQKRHLSFNQYRAPRIALGDSSKAKPWLDHVHKIYPDDAEHIIRWLAHHRQHPGNKLNHALVLGGAQGIGKDSLLEPAKHAIGPWNFHEISPAHLLGQFNSFAKSVILRINEGRDLGDIDRFKFYDHTKIYTAAPPDVLRVNEKHLKEYHVLNCLGLIITTNHKTDGLYLPADDRRHYVAWSATKERLPGGLLERAMEIFRRWRQ